jgi:hypothetical protein
MIKSMEPDEETSEDGSPDCTALDSGVGDEWNALPDETKSQKRLNVFKHNQIENQRCRE